MNSKTAIWIGVAVGSTLGGLIPSLWGASMFSLWSVVLSTVGGIAGIYFGYKISKY